MDSSGDDPEDTPSLASANEAQDGDAGSPWDLTPAETALSCVVMVVLCLVSQLANIGIIYYERVVPDTYRTLLNKIAALASLYKVVIATATFPVITVRLLIGRGLGKLTCHLHTFLFVSALAQLLLSYNELIIAHYVYVCKLRAVGLIKDELIMQFVVWLNLALGLFAGFIHLLTVHTPARMYHNFCTDEFQLAEEENGGRGVHDIQTP